MTLNPIKNFAALGDYDKPWLWTTKKVKYTLWDFVGVTFSACMFFVWASYYMWKMYLELNVMGSGMEIFMKMFPMFYLGFLLLFGTLIYDKWCKVDTMIEVKVRK